MHDFCIIWLQETQIIYALQIIYYQRIFSTFYLKKLHTTEQTIKTDAQTGIDSAHACTDV